MVACQRGSACAGQPGLPEQVACWPGCVCSGCQPAMLRLCGRMTQAWHSKAQVARHAPCLTGMDTHCGSSRQPCASSDKLVVGGEQSHLGRVEAEQL